MKGLALETIAYFLLALVGVSLFMIFLGTKVSPSLREGYCKLLLGLHGYLPLPDFMRVSLPSYCSYSKGNIAMEECVINTPDVNRVSFEIASRIVACWEKTGNVNYASDVICYECYLSQGVKGMVSWDNVKPLVESYNKDYPSYVEWKAGVVTQKGSLAIKYNATQKMVVVE